MHLEKKEDFFSVLFLKLLDPEDGTGGTLLAESMMNNHQTKIKQNQNFFHYICLH